MKTTTINVSEPIYEEFRQYAKKTDRKASELIREALEPYPATAHATADFVEGSATSERRRPYFGNYGGRRYFGRDAR